jgi:hypothetical protein
MKEEASIKSSEVMLSNLKKGMFGTMQALIVWLILLVFLFKYTWWAWIPLFGISYGFVDQAVEYTIRKRSGSNEEIKVTKGALGAWFGFLIVFYIMYTLFGWVWFGLIAMVGTLFGALYATNDYFLKIKQLRKNSPSMISAQNVQVKTPTDDLILTSGENTRVNNPMAQYCPHVVLNSVQEPNFAPFVVHK